MDDVFAQASLAWLAGSLWRCPFERFLLGEIGGGGSCAGGGGVCGLARARNLNGNGMHVKAIGSVLLWAFTTMMPREEFKLLRPPSNFKALEAAIAGEAEGGADFMDIEFDHRDLQFHKRKRRKLQRDNSIASDIAIANADSIDVCTG
jgi:hypothetical protein